jgi:hypothetical protein
MHLPLSCFVTILVALSTAIAAVEQPSGSVKPDPQPRDPTMREDRVWKALSADPLDVDPMATSKSAARLSGAATPPPALPKIAVLGLITGTKGTAALVTIEQRRVVVRQGSVITDQAGRAWLVTAVAADHLILTSSQLTLHASFGVLP